MYKMYNAQLDDESDDDKNSLNSSFWSDGEREEEEEEEEVIERVIGEEDSKPAEESLQEASEEGKPGLNNMSEESSEGGSDDDDEKSCSSSCDSPAQSLMTSGYGTYRPEEQDGGDYRDDRSDEAFDQDSRGDLSEMRDDEEDGRSLCSFGGFDVEPGGRDYSETRPPSVLADAEPEAQVAAEEDEDQAEEEKFKDTVFKEAATNVTLEEQPHVAVNDDKLIMDEKNLEGGSVDAEGGNQHERPEEEEEVRECKEENNVQKEDGVESEGSDESSSNRDIKFIDSKVDFSQMTYDEMCEEWEGNLRQRKEAASCLEERLAELHLSTSAQRDFETENEDETSQSDSQSSEISMGAFESYIRGMTRAQSDGDIRPKPKSFIRPVMSQQTIKKTDPVAKYFQYKQLWEMFKIPGEKDRKALRLEIKERLAYQPPPPKPRRVYVPNTYIVPTEKKRSSLRWEIRNDLANGLVPYKFSYRF